MLQGFIAFQVANTFYQRCKKIKLPLHLQGQLARASSSVVLNIAEGSGRRTQSDQARLYSVALGSLRECQAIFEMEAITDPELLAQADRLGAILFKLTRRSKPKQKND
jgi:four helix bundle protein